MPTHQATAQAIYMQRLIEIAQEQLSAKATDMTELAFDPQGRLLIDVTLSEIEQRKIISAINKSTGHSPPFSQSDGGLKAALGRKFTPTTTISLDTNNLPTLHQRFKEKLTAKLSTMNLEEKYPDASKTALINNILYRMDGCQQTTHASPQAKGSIIALQQEFHFHMALVSRVYQKILSNKSIEDKAAIETKMKRAQQEAMLLINELVMTAYAKALVPATLDNFNGSMNIAVLNKALDKARKELFPKAHAILRQTMQKTGLKLSAKDLEKKQLKYLAEGMTATANDLLHTDHGQGLAIWIAGSEHTAHHRVVGEQFAHRQIITHILNADDHISANPNHRLQIRTPSPVMKEGLTDNKAYIADVRIKLTAITREYDLKTRLVPHGTMQRAFIYNSYTAINDTLGDINGNLQTQSAMHILQGAHRYNAAQLRDHPPVYCLVQNISVNGFGDQLGYGTGNPLIEESTLMAEMAFLHTLYDTAAPEQQQQIERIFNRYAVFLERKLDSESFFSQVAEGYKAKTLIQELKTQWRQEQLPPVANEPIQQQAKLALKTLIANELHGHHEFSKLVQSLSVFVEEASIGGCKSGNERAQAINGRVSVLDSVATGKSQATDEVMKLLSALARGTGNVKKTAQALKSVIDTDYNQVGLQSAASNISSLDQGSSAKIEAKPAFLNAFWMPKFVAKIISKLFLSRNYAEESNLNNNQQSESGALQAHKKLTTQMRSAWAEPFKKTAYEPSFKSSDRRIRPKMGWPLAEQEKRILPDLHFGSGTLRVTPSQSPPSSSPITHPQSHAVENEDDPNDDDLPPSGTQIHY
ncbi:MAG: hypothetical protein ACHP65_06840 [Legionellales bacterium]